MTFLGILILLSLIPAAIANDKGRRFFPWWLYSLLLFPIALIHSLMIRPVRPCPWCAEDVRLEAHICPHCQRNLTEPEPASSRQSPLLFEVPSESHSRLIGLGSKITGALLTAVLVMVGLGIFVGYLVLGYGR